MTTKDRNRSRPIGRSNAQKPQNAATSTFNNSNGIQFQ